MIYSFDVLLYRNVLLETPALRQTNWPITKELRKSILGGHWIQSRGPLKDRPWESGNFMLW